MAKPDPRWPDAQLSRHDLCRPNSISCRHNQNSLPAPCLRALRRTKEKACDAPTPMKLGRCCRWSYAMAGHDPMAAIRPGRTCAGTAVSQTAMGQNRAEVRTVPLPLPLSRGRGRISSPESPTRGPVAGSLKIGGRDGTSKTGRTYPDIIDLENSRHRVSTERGSPDRTVTLESRTAARRFKAPTDLSLGQDRRRAQPEKCFGTNAGGTDGGSCGGEAPEPLRYRCCRNP